LMSVGPRPTSTGDRLPELLAVMRRLRAECPWQSTQTHRSLVRYLIEESHETVEAVESGDDEHLAEELGDLLWQVCVHAVIAEERGAFDLDDVVAGLVDKLHRRNPHVFGDVTATDAAEVDATWQRMKAVEKARVGVTDGLPASLPALLYADKVLERLSSIEPAGIPDADIGDRLLALVAEARVDQVDPEQALRDAVRRRLDGVHESTDDRR
jgi:XTP/dITP diphosphohydrolase